MSDEISTQLREWRDAVAANRGLTADDVDELEDHLLAEYQDLSALGLSTTRRCSWQNTVWVR